ncbi:hypothetical protein BH23BAC2_BH23BAC2_04820 [soil metagenome]
MEFITIYRSQEISEITLIKHLLDENKIDYQIFDETTSGIIAGANVTGSRIQVPKNEVDHAKAVLLENGFLGDWQKGRRKSNTQPRVSKWVLIFLAALVLIIVSFLIMWFMNP